MPPVTTPTTFSGLLFAFVLFLIGLGITYYVMFRKDPTKVKAETQKVEGWISDLFHKNADTAAQQAATAQTQATTVAALVTALPAPPAAQAAPTAAVVSDKLPAQVSPSASVATTALPTAVVPAAELAPAPNTPTIAGMVVDVYPQLPPGAPNTVVMGVTGHVVTLPTDADTSTIGYAIRTSMQIGMDTGAAGGLQLLQGGAREFGGYGEVKSTWPIVVDWYANMQAYANSKTHGAPVAQTSSGAVNGTGALQWGAATDIDKLFALKTLVVRSVTTGGVNFPVEMNRIFGGDVQWSNWKEANETKIEAYDPSTYDGILKGIV